MIHGLYDLVAPGSPRDDDSEVNRLSEQGVGTLAARGHDRVRVEVAGEDRAARTGSRASRMARSRFVPRPSGSLRSISATSHAARIAIPSDSVDANATTIPADRNARSNADLTDASSSTTRGRLLISARASAAAASSFQNHATCSMCHGAPAAQRLGRLLLLTLGLSTSGRDWCAVSSGVVHIGR
jgi:hypothetical protein